MPCQHQSFYDPSNITMRTKHGSTTTTALMEEDGLLDGFQWSPWQLRKPEGAPTQCVVECDRDEDCVIGLCSYIVDLILVCCHRFNFYQVHIMDRIVGNAMKEHTGNEVANLRKLRRDLVRWKTVLTHPGATWSDILFVRLCNQKRMASRVLALQDAPANARCGVYDGATGTLCDARPCAATAYCLPHRAQLLRGWGLCDAQGLAIEFPALFSTQI